jgi:hypothetical protein
MGFKGQCHEIFDPQFFSSINPPWVLIHGLKPFRIWLRNRREIRDNRLKSSASALRQFLNMTRTSGYTKKLRIMS